MADVIIVGGGICGLLGATLLAADGHTVTVVERNPMEPPGDADEAWEAWERPGVNQFRLLHYVQPRFRLEVEQHVPAVIHELERFGANRHLATVELPERFTGGPADGDERFTTVTGRRPVLETAVATVAAATPGVTVRRGTGMAELLVGTSANGGTPHVVGVRLESGEERHADLVVDATGRRSRLPDRLAALGARPVVEDAEDSGLVYYGRHFRSRDGSVPPVLGPILGNAGTFSTLTLPADNGTWGLGILAAAADKEMRAVKQVSCWEAVWRSVPFVEHWLGGTPLDDGVAVMANIPDRIRRFVIDGEPVATGVVALADSWACTNPALGRGISIGLLHALTLCATIRDPGLDDPVAFARAFDEATIADVEPWYRATVGIDRSRLAEMTALRERGIWEPDDPQAQVVAAFLTGAWHDPVLLRAFLEVATMLAMPADVLGREGMFERVLAQAEAVSPFAVPSREAVLTLLD